MCRALKTNTDETQQRFNETCNKTFDETTLDEIKTYDPYKFKIESLLPEWLESKNDFNEAKRFIDDIRVDMNKVKAIKEDKKVFDDLNKLIIDINNNKVKKEDAVESLNKSIPDVDQLKQKQSTAFKNTMIHVVYQLFNSFGFNEELNHYLAKKCKYYYLAKKNHS